MKTIVEAEKRIATAESYTAGLLKKTKKWVKPFLIIAAIYLIGIVAILRANFNYVDDMGRIIYGYKQWDTISRFLASFLSNFIHADIYLTDVSPLTQILAVLELSAAALIVLYLFTGKHEFNFWQYAAVVPLGLSPYFLECISYKFDAPYMALSVLAAVIPLLFRWKKVWVYALASVLSILAVCTSYQASTGIFPMLVILLGLRDWTKGKDKKAILIYWGTSIVGYLVGLIIFKLFIMVPNTYASGAINLTTIYDHLLTYYKTVLSDFKSAWIKLIAVILLAFLVALVKGSEKNKIVTVVLSLLAAVSLFMAAFGLYPALAEPLYLPRAMYGFGVLISFLMIEISSETRIYWGKVVSAGLAWMFFVFSFTYGNALYMQEQYTDYRVTMVAEAINDLYVENADQEKEVQIIGSIGYAPAIQNMPQNYNMLNRLIPVTFCQSWGWGSTGLRFFYGLGDLAGNFYTDFPELNLPLLKETQLYTIWGDDTHILVELR